MSTSKSISLSSEASHRATDPKTRTFLAPWRAAICRIASRFVSTSSLTPICVFRHLDGISESHSLPIFAHFTHTHSNDFANVFQSFFECPALRMTSPERQHICHIKTILILFINHLESMVFRD